ncbi:MAG: 3-hydroxyacyl-CoA dehydrogenase NAD-binding domain-containing protein [Planctomycetota bacterium]|jgi:3-hydroxyacyl-CoA dehydrogenase
MDTKTGKIGIVGTGLIGAGWAAFYASKGFAVSLYDADASAGHTGRDRTLDCLVSLRDHGLLDPETHDRAAASVTVTDDLSEAVEGAGLVQESVTERYDVKKDVFRHIDRACEPEAIVASSSSGLLISELQTVMGHPGRSLIAHPFNPPHLIPLVELVPGNATDPKALAEAKAFFESLGKVPVVLKKEIPGHVANRLQAALWREAIDLVLKGVASVADVDKALAAGPGIRWALLGPHMIFHLAGGPGGIKHFIDHIGGSFDSLWKDMASWTSLPAETADALVSGVREETGDRPLQEIGRWRDEKVVQLLKAIYGT